MHSWDTTGRFCLFVQGNAAGDEYAADDLYVVQSIEVVRTTVYETPWSVVRVLLFSTCSVGWISTL